MRLMTAKEALLRAEVKETTSPKLSEEIPNLERAPAASVTSAFLECSVESPIDFHEWGCVLFHGFAKAVSSLAVFHEKLLPGRYHEYFRMISRVLESILHPGAKGVVFRTEGSDAASLRSGKATISPAPSCPE